MKRFLKGFLAVMMVLMCLPITGWATVKTPTTDAKVSMTVDKTTILKIAAKGWKIQSVKATSNSKVVKVKASGKKISVTAVRVGEAVITTRVNAKKDRRKSFTLKTKVTVNPIKDEWIPGSAQLTRMSRASDALGYGVRLDFKEDFAQNKYRVYLDGMDVTAHCTAQHGDGVGASTLLQVSSPKVLDNGKHKIVLHVDGYAEYTCNFIIKDKREVRKNCALVYKNGRVNATTKEKCSYLFLVRDVMPSYEKGALEIYIDGAKAAPLNSWDFHEGLGVSGDGMVLVRMPQSKYPITPDSLHRVKVICEGFDDFDEDVLFSGSW